MRDKELLNHPCKHSPAISQYISRTHETNSEIFDNYLSLVEMLLTPSCSIIPIGCLIEVIGTCPEVFSKRFAPKFDLIMVMFVINFLYINSWFYFNLFFFPQNLLGHTKEEVRENVALLLSILCVHTMSEEKLTEMATNLLTKLEKKSLENQHGAILTLGHIVERKMMQAQSSGGQKITWSLHESIILEIGSVFY